MQFGYPRLVRVEDGLVGLGGVDEVGHVLAVLGHDQLQGILALLQGGPELLVLVLELSYVSVLLLNA